MCEYKVLIMQAKICQEQLNKYAKEGWRLSAMTSTHSDGREVVVALERTVDNTKEV